ncbi:MAG: oxidoreductase [Planctomycetes bacterium]|nr:oxidoreductase [Planctomycetota bacterium]
MTVLQLPWLELSIAIAICGSLFVSRWRDPSRAYHWGLVCIGVVFACTLVAWLGYYLGVTDDELNRFSPQLKLFGRRLFSLDELSSPLVPTVALLHFLTALATARTKMRRYSFSWSLAAEAIRLATFSCEEPWVVVGLLAVATVPPYIELVNRNRPTRVYVLHMALFVTLLIGGWSLVAAAGGSYTSSQANIGTILLMAAILVRCGSIPAHCWVTDWFEHASFGIGLLFVVPLSGVYAAVRLVLPIAPEWGLRGIGLISLATAVYASGMSIVQRDARRFFAYLFLSHASLVLVGLELRTPLSLTASLCLWFSEMLSLGGFGLALRALEARFGRLSLVKFQGLYSHSPSLAVCFMLTGLACVGFPATVGFISTELLVDSAVSFSSSVCVAVLAATALNGISIVRAYLLLFTGARHVSAVSLEIGLRERIAVLTLAALILGGGIFPQPGVSSRYQAAEEILQRRDQAKLAETKPPTEMQPISK